MMLVLCLSLSTVRGFHQYEAPNLIDLLLKKLSDPEFVNKLRDIQLESRSLETDHAKKGSKQKTETLYEFIKSGYNAVQIDVPLPNVVAVYVRELDVYFVACYRPPSYMNEKNDSLKSFLSDFVDGKSVVVMGDFNLPSLRWIEDGFVDRNSTSFDKGFLEVFLLLGLCQWVSQGTFHPSGNVLDLIFTSDSDVVGDVTVMPPLPGCHHSPVVVEYFPHKLEENVSDVVDGRLWFKGNYRAINEYLLTEDWMSKFEGGSAEENYSYLSSVLLALINCYIPCRPISCELPRWMSRPPRCLMRERSVAWNEYKRLREQFGRDSQNVLCALSHFNVLNHRYRNFSKQKQCDYEVSLIGRISTSPKLFHSYIRRRKKGRSVIGPLKSSSGVVSDKFQMCELLAMPVPFVKCIE